MSHPNKTDSQQQMMLPTMAPHTQQQQQQQQNLHQQQQQQQQQQPGGSSFPYTQIMQPTQVGQLPSSSWSLDYSKAPVPGLEQSLPSDFDPEAIRDLTLPPQAVGDPTRQPAYNEMFSAFDEERNRATMSGQFFRTFGEILVDRCCSVGRNDVRYEKIRFRSSRPYAATDGTIKRYETTINRSDVLGFINSLAYFVPECVASNSAIFNDFCKSAPVRMLVAQVALQNRLRLVPLEE